MKVSVEIVNAFIDGIRVEIPLVGFWIQIA